MKQKIFQEYKIGYSLDPNNIYKNPQLTKSYDPNFVAGKKLDNGERL